MPKMPIDWLTNEELEEIYKSNKERIDATREYRRKCQQ